MRRSAAITGLVVCALTSHARAQVDAGIPKVDLAIVGPGGSADLVEERVGSWFRAQHTALVNRRVAILDPTAVLAAEGGAGVQVWIVLTDPQLVQVFFTVRERAGETPRYLVTDVALGTGLDELGVEQLAQIVYPSAVALWAGNVESSRVDVEQELRHRAGDGQATSPPLFLQAPPPEHASSRGSRPVAIGAEYGVAMPGAGFAQTVGAHAAIVRGHAIGARLHLDAVLPRQTSASGVELQLAGARAALGATVAHPISGRASLVGELGGAVELVRYRTGAIDDPSLTATPGGFDAQPLAYTRCGVRVAVGAVMLGLEATLDVHLRRTHYDVMSGGTQFEVVVPWRVQPGVAAALTW